MKRKKNKKKVNNQSSRQLQRASFNHFYKQIHHYLRVIDCKELAELFDKESCALLYDRVRNLYLPKVRIARGVSISTKTRKLISSELEYLIAKKKIKFNDHIQFSPKEIVQYLALIELFVRFKEDEPFDLNRTRLIQKYNEKIPDFVSLLKEAVQEICHVAQYLSSNMTRMNTSLCWLQYQNCPQGDEDRRIVLELNEYIPNKETMVIDHYPRPVYPLSLPLINSGPKEIFIPAWRIRIPKGVKKPDARSGFPVYFQNHLLHRLEERLDCFSLHVSQLWLYNSLEEAKFVYYKGRRLVEYIAEDNIKLGYVLLEFHKDRLLAKTFLMLTNTGTPEGDKLKQISGLEKCDHQYWAIDKLSTFYGSDLKDNPKTRILFEQAGCGDLFKEISVLGMHSIEPSGTQANQILRYLEGSKDDGEMLMAV